ncbi:MAG: hypothetical protein ACD_34C00237G0004 [uncultured bacterium]|nr:MAG: hypothetical protein ACD_34C00237G0004 [uncultured bacterium]
MKPKELFAIIPFEHGGMTAYVNLMVQNIPEVH